MEAGIAKPLPSGLEMKDQLSEVREVRTLLGCDREVDERPSAQRCSVERYIISHRAAFTE